MAEYSGTERILSMKHHWDLDGIGMTSQRARDRLTAKLKQQGISNTDVLAEMASLPRHIFVDSALSHRAYEDIALPIGYKQTLSRPWTVARMTEVLSDLPERPASILEIGTGSGYQTALLARLFDQIFTVERISSLQQQAAHRFSALQLNNIRMRHGDGFEGWDEYALFDAIIVTAAPSFVPDNLIRQLKTGGCMLLPVGNKEQQELIRITSTSSGIKQESLGDVHFVPLLDGVI